MSGFFFNPKHGVFSRLIDRFFTSQESKQSKEAAKLSEKDQEISALRKEISELRQRMAHLDRELIKTTHYLKIVLLYIDSHLPENTTDVFLQELLKEVRAERTDFKA